MRIYLDLSLFASPSKCLGNVTGALDVLSLPRVDAQFPPFNVSEKEDSLELIRGFGNSIVTNVDDGEPRLFGSELSVMVDSVFSDEGEARRFAEMLNRNFGLTFCEF